FFSSRRRHTRLVSDWSSDVCSSDLTARKRREQGADRRHHHREAARHPTKERAEEADETDGRLALGQDVARRGEEGYGRERGRGHEAVDLGRDRGNRRAVAEEKEKRDPAHRDEDGG